MKLLKQEKLLLNGGQIILVDTSILIDLFSKTDKSNSTLIALVKLGYGYCISAITEYEIYTGVTLVQIDFWDDFLRTTQVLPFDKAVARVDINRNLKRMRNQIAIPDLFIAATAIANDLSFATLNKKHFDRIDTLNIITE